jgi:hypothetical protein
MSGVDMTAAVSGRGHGGEWLARELNPGTPGGIGCWIP